MLAIFRLLIGIGTSLALANEMTPDSPEAIPNVRYQQPRHLYLSQGDILLYIFSLTKKPYRISAAN